MSINALKAAEALRQAGHRLTQVRLKLLEIFAAADMPLSPLEVMKRLKRTKLSPHKTTVYRELEFLTEEKILKEVVFDDGRTRYEGAGEGHYHHLVCLSCKNVDKVEMHNDLDREEKLIERTRKFKIKRHSLEFYGLCAGCQK